MHKFEQSLAGERWTNDRLPIIRRLGEVIRPEGAQVRKARIVLAGHRIIPRIVQDLAVVDVVLRVCREIELNEATLSHPLEAHPESPHDFPVTHDDNVLVITLAV